jgi:O-antigen/teichoic acid export membrane protein
MLTAIWRRRPLGDFAQNAGLVMAGTVVAQVLPLLFYPVFTRLYSPADFGTFATISMIATPLAIVASGTYEQAFLIARSSLSAANLFLFILLRSAIILLPALLLLLALRDPIAIALADPALRVALIFVPLISFGQVVYNCTAEWLVRETAFKDLSANRISQSVALALPKLGFGVGGWFGGGLVLGEALGRLVYVGYSFRQVWRGPMSRFATSRSRMAAMGKRYRNFPRVMVPDQLINTFAGSIHVLIIGYAFGPTELGYVSLLFSALYLPVTIVSSSLKDVFRQRASVDYARDGNCRPLYFRLLWPVTLLGLVGFGLLYLLSPWLFVFVFGPKWAAVGEYARLLIPMFFFNFVAMSLGGVLVIANKMGTSLVWQVTGLLLATLALLAGVTVFENVADTLLLFTLARSMSYVHYMVLSYKHAKRPIGV